MSGGLDLRLVPLVLSLGLDTFSTSAVIGIAPLPRQTRMYLALSFAICEGLMPAVGLIVGRPLGQAFGHWSLYVAAVLLIITGLWILRDALEDDDDGETSAVTRAVATGGIPLVGVALSVSLDELAVGFSFGVLRLPVVPAIIAIALQALVLGLCGQWLGAKVGRTIGGRAEMVSGGVLCVLGIGLACARLSGVGVS